MKLALYLGCTIQTEQYAYEISAREVLPRLGIESIDLKDAGCCGYPPLRGINTLGWIFLSARNLALAEKLGLDVLPLCNGCHLSLCEAKRYLKVDPKLMEYINSLLAIEGLEYTGKVEVTHILEVLYGAVGIKKIKNSVRRPLQGLKLAAHYGCHAIRPSKLGRPDDADDPHKLEELIRALGAESEDYSERLDCCGSGLAIASGETTLSIAGSKLKAVQEHGFNGLITICPFCQKIFDARQSAIKRVLHEEALSLPVLYYTQLLGLSMGIDIEKIGLNLNLSSVEKLLDKL